MVGSAAASAWHEQTAYRGSGVVMFFPSLGPIPGRNDVRL